MGWIKAIKIDESTNPSSISKAEFSKNLRASDSVKCLITTQTADELVLWDDKGRVYSLDVHKIPTTRFGEHLSNFMKLPSGHSITHLSYKSQVILITSNMMTMRVDLSSISLSSRGTKIIDFEPECFLSHLV